jgi:hypothetical protein
MTIKDIGVWNYTFAGHHLDCEQRLIKSKEKCFHNVPNGFQELGIYALAAIFSSS